MEEAYRLYKKGIEELKAGNGPAALSYFEKAAALDTTPETASCLGLCLAHERGQVQKGQSLCEEAISRDPANPLHYLNLGKIHVLTANKPEAIKAFRNGLESAYDERLIAALDKLGTRKPPVLAFLARDHFINKYLGKLLHKLGIK